MYFKILHNDMTSYHGYVYKEGLNIDSKKFDDHEICSAGLHFSDEDHILCFCTYGDLIADVYVPDDERELMLYKGNYKAHSIILDNIRPLWSYNTLCDLIGKYKVNIHAGDDYPAKYLIKTGKYKELRHLLIFFSENDLYKLVKEVNDYKALKILLSYYVSPSFGHNYLMHKYIENYQYDLCGLLIEYGANLDGLSKREYILLKINLFLLKLEEKLKNIFRITIY